MNIKNANKPLKHKHIIDCCTASNMLNVAKRIGCNKECMGNTGKSRLKERLRGYDN